VEMHFVTYEWLE